MCKNIYCQQLQWCWCCENCFSEYYSWVLCMFFFVLSLKNKRDNLAYLWILQSETNAALIVLMRTTNFVSSYLQYNIWSMTNCFWDFLELSTIKSEIAKLYLNEKCICHLFAVTAKHLSLLFELDFTKMCSAY